MDAHAGWAICRWGAAPGPSGWTVVVPGAHLGYGKSRDAIELL